MKRIPSRYGWWWWIHNNMNVLNTTEVQKRKFLPGGERSTCCTFLLHSALTSTINNKFTLYDLVSPRPRWPVWSSDGWWAHLSWSPMAPFLPPALTMSVPVITSKNKWKYLQTHDPYIKTTLCTCPSNTGILNIKKRSFYLYFMLGCTSDYTIVIMGFTGRLKIFKSSSYHLFPFN